MALNNAEVLVSFTGNTEDLSKKTKEADQLVKGFGKGIGNVLSGIGKTALTTSALIVTAVAKGIGDIVESSVKAYAEFEQLEGGLVSLFGDGSVEMQTILEQSEEAYKNLTMSQNDYLTAFQSSYPLVNAGLSENADAIEYTNKTLQLSSDLFNTYGGSIEYYQNAINWALKGSFVYLDNLNLGIKGTQEGFIEAANNSGILGRNIQDVSELTNDEIIDVIQHYAEAYGVWGKTSEEASSTIIGSLNMVKATWSNFVSGLSKDDADIDGLINNLIDSAMTFANNIMPVIMRAIDGIAQALPKIATMIGDLLPGLIDSLLPPLIDTLLALVQSLMDNLPSIIDTLMNGIVKLITGASEILPDLIEVVLDGAIAIVEALGNALPTILPALIDAIIQGFIKITEKTPEIIQAGITLLNGLIDAIPLIIASLVENLPLIVVAIVKSLIEGIPELLLGSIQLLFAIIEAIPTLIDTLMEDAPEIIDALNESITSSESLRKIYNAAKDLFYKMIEGLANVLPQIWDAGKNLVMGLWNGINDHVQWVVNKIKGFGNSILKAIKGIFGIHSPSTEFEWIGKMNMVGFEDGMENMKGKIQDTIDSVFSIQPDVNGSLSSTYSPQMNIIVQNNMEYDPIGQLVSNVKTFSGGAKNDYNWGAGL